MKIEVVQVGYLETNCYLLKIKDKVLIVDPGDEYEKIGELVGKSKILGILVTHHHKDHVGALSAFKNIPIYDGSNTEETLYHIEDFSFEVIKTPGHTKDSISFYFEKEKRMFVGDFLFYHSIGRMDLGGNEEDMIHSLKKISIYPKETILYPGHGRSTSLKEELSNNPFLTFLGSRNID